MRAGERRYFAAEIAFRPIDAFAEREADKARDLDRPADLALGFFERLRDGLLTVFDDVALIEQADLLVEGLEPGLDDLLDDVGRLALALWFRQARSSRAG